MLLEDVNDVLNMACYLKRIVPPTEWVEEMIAEQEMSKLNLI